MTLAQRSPAGQPLVEKSTDRYMITNDCTRCGVC